MSNIVGTLAKKDFSTGEILLLDHICVFGFCLVGSSFYTDVSILRFCEVLLTKCHSFLV